MVYVIIEQSRSTRSGNLEGQTLAPPRMIDPWPTSREEADLRASALSKGFHHNGRKAEGDYWWGREDCREVRFLVP